MTHACKQASGPCCAVLLPQVVKASVDAQNGRILDTFYVQDMSGAKVSEGDAINVKRSLEVGILMAPL